MLIQNSYYLGQYYSHQREKRKEKSTDERKPVPSPVNPHTSSFGLDYFLKMLF